MTDQDQNDQAEPPGSSLADKINRLFDTLHKRNGSPVSNEEVASAINARGGPKISASYLWLLRTGQRTNPRAHHLEALAEHFGVTPAYFFDLEVARKIERELDLIKAMRDSGVQHLALRASGLSPDVLTAITVMIEQARKAQGLADPPGRPAAPPPAPTTTDEPKGDT